MTDEDIVAALAEVLYEKPVHYDRASLRVQAAALLPLVRRVAEQRAAEELERAVSAVQAVYDMQCPVMPSDRYVGAGAYYAHSWWETVLGGRLRDLRARAAALTATPNHGTDAT